jgi:hypothetical protein
MAQSRRRKLLLRKRPTQKMVPLRSRKLRVLKPIRAAAISFLSCPRIFTAAFHTQFYIFARTRVRPACGALGDLRVASGRKRNDPRQTDRGDPKRYRLDRAAKITGAIAKLNREKYIGFALLRAIALRLLTQG